MRATRVRPFVLASVFLPMAGAALLLTMSAADAAPTFAATASITNAPQYLGDTAGTVFTFTVTNTGSEVTIGAVEVERPSNGWSVMSCGTAPAGWSVQAADPRCRYRSGEGGSDDILPGQSRQFSVRASTLPGTVNRVGVWNVEVSKSNQFDQPSLLTAAEGTNGGLTTTAYTWEVTDAVVANAAVAAGSACPAADKDAITSSTQTIVVCGRNHATTALTPVAAYSSLGGTFLASSGTFSSGSIPANSGPVVVASWTGATVAALPGTNLTVVATIGSAANQTSPVTTLTGYEAINQPPVVVNDAYSVAEDGTLTVAAPGVLGNDSDPEGQPITAVLDTGPAHAASFALNANGSFSYSPAANYSGSDSFTYRAHDGIQPSAPATVNITVTGVNDAPVNTAPASVSTTEDAAYAFASGALSVSDVDSGALDVAAHLTATHATVTTATAGVTVTGNGTDDVTVTGPVTAVAAAIDGLTLTPEANYFGGATFTLSTSDLGHSGSGGALTDTDSVAVTILSVNDAPSFTPGTDQTVAEDAAAQSVAWATAISKGPANESGQTLTFQVTNDNAALFQTAPAISAGGTLTYRAAADASGTALVTVVLHDDGGVANGGSDSSVAVTFSITVNAVNDAPSAVAQSYSAHTNMRLHVTGLLTGATDAHDAGSYTPSFTLSSVTPLSCAGCGISNVGADGSFDFEPPAGQTGSYTLQYTVDDTGYPAPGATSAPATITVTVSGPVIWFVDGTVAGPGTGTLADPFKTLTSAAAVATGAGSRIFVSSGSVTGSISQPANAWLVGQGVSGASFDAVFGITPPAGTVARPAINGTRPTITGGVSLGDGSVVRGVNLTPASGTAGITGNGDDGVTVGETSVTATNAAALDVRSSQGSTISLTKASASGASAGIYLEDVNNVTPGSVAVTGTGTAASGGTISGSTGSGVHLDTVNGVSLSWLSVSGSTGEGIDGSAVTGLSVTDSAVSGSGTHGISLANLRGSSSLTRVTASGSAGDNARVFTSSGSLTLGVTDSTFRDNDASTGGNGLLVEADGSANVTLTASGNSFLRNHTDGLAVFAVSSTKMTANVTGGTYVVDSGVGLDIETNAPGGLAYTVNGGTVTGCLACGSPVVVYKGTGATGTGANALAGTLTGMTVSNGDSTNAPGIWVHAEGAGATRIAVTNNTVSAVAHNGILVTAGNGSSAMDATITGNTITIPNVAGALQGIQVDSGTISGDTTAVCADVKTNTVSDPATSDVRVRNRQAGTQFRLPGYAGGATSTATVTSFLLSQNTIADAAAVVGSSPGFAGGAACASP
jgi:VCBS repeat-containing protein